MDNKDKAKSIGNAKSIGKAEVNVCKRVLAAICATFRAGTPEESLKRFMISFNAVNGCIHHWEDFVLWLKTDEWRNTQVSVVGEFERLKEISHVKKEYSKVGGCSDMLSVLKWSEPQAAAAAAAEAAAAAAEAAAAAAGTECDYRLIGSKPWAAKD